MVSFNSAFVQTDEINQCDNCSRICSKDNKYNNCQSFEKIKKLDEAKNG